MLEGYDAIEEILSGSSQNRLDEDDDIFSQILGESKSFVEAPQEEPQFTQVQRQDMLTPPRFEDETPRPEDYDPTKDPNAPEYNPKWWTPSGYVHHSLQSPEEYADAIDPMGNFRDPAKARAAMIEMSRRRKQEQLDSFKELPPEAQSEIRNKNMEKIYTSAIENLDKMDAALQSEEAGQVIATLGNYVGSWESLAKAPAYWVTKAGSWALDRALPNSGISKAMNELQDVLGEESAYKQWAKEEQARFIKDMKASGNHGLAAAYGGIQGIANAAVGMLAMTAGWSKLFQSTKSLPVLGKVLSFGDDAVLAGLTEVGGSAAWNSGFAYRIFQGAARMAIKTAIETTQGTPEQRMQAMSISFAYGMTPLLSYRLAGLVTPANATASTINLGRFVADFLTNSVITHRGLLEHLATGQNKYTDDSLVQLFGEAMLSSKQRGGGILDALAEFYSNPDVAASVGADVFGSWGAFGSKQNEIMHRAFTDAVQKQAQAFPKAIAELEQTTREAEKSLRRRSFQATPDMRSLRLAPPSQEGRPTKAMRTALSPTTHGEIAGVDIRGEQMDLPNTPFVRQQITELDRQAQESQARQDQVAQRGAGFVENDFNGVVDRLLDKDELQKLSSELFQDNEAHTLKEIYNALGITESDIHVSRYQANLAKFEAETGHKVTDDEATMIAEWTIKEFTSAKHIPKDQRDADVIRKNLMGEGVPVKETSRWAEMVRKSQEKFQKDLEGLETEKAPAGTQNLGAKIDAAMAEQTEMMPRGQSIADQLGGAKVGETATKPKATSMAQAFAEAEGVAGKSSKTPNAPKQTKVYLEDSKTDATSELKSGSGKTLYRKVAGTDEWVVKAPTSKGWRQANARDVKIIEAIQRKSATPPKPKSGVPPKAERPVVEAPAVTQERAEEIKDEIAIRREALKEDGADKKTLNAEIAELEAELTAKPTGEAPKVVTSDVKATAEQTRPALEATKEYKAWKQLSEDLAELTDEASKTQIEAAKQAVMSLPEYQAWQDSLPKPDMADSLFKRPPKVELNEPQKALKSIDEAIKTSTSARGVLRKLGDVLTTKEEREQGFTLSTPPEVSLRNNMTWYQQEGNKRILYQIKNARGRLVITRDDGGKVEEVGFSKKTGRDSTDVYKKGLSLFALGMGRLGDKPADIVKYLRERVGIEPEMLSTEMRQYLGLPMIDEAPMSAVKMPQAVVDGLIYKGNKQATWYYPEYAIIDGKPQVGYEESRPFLYDGRLWQTVAVGQSKTAGRVYAIRRMDTGARTVIKKSQFDQRIYENPDVAKLRYKRDKTIAISRGLKPEAKRALAKLAPKNSIKMPAEPAETSIADVGITKPNQLSMIADKLKALTKKQKDGIDAYLKNAVNEATESLKSANIENIAEQQRNIYSMRRVSAQLKSLQVSKSLDATDVSIIQNQMYLRTFNEIASRRNAISGDSTTEGVKLLMKQLETFNEAVETRESGFGFKVFPTESETTEVQIKVLNALYTNPEMAEFQQLLNKLYSIDEKGAIKRDATIETVDDFFQIRPLLADKIQRLIDSVYKPPSTSLSKSTTPAALAAKEAIDGTVLLNTSIKLMTGAESFKFGALTEAGIRKEAEAEFKASNNDINSQAFEERVEALLKDLPARKQAARDFMAQASVSLYNFIRNNVAYTTGGEGVRTSDRALVKIWQDAMFARDADEKGMELYKEEANRLRDLAKIAFPNNDRREWVLLQTLTQKLSTGNRENMVSNISNPNEGLFKSLGPDGVRAVTEAQALAENPLAPREGEMDEVFKALSGYKTAQKELGGFKKRGTTLTSNLKNFLFEETRRIDANNAFAKSRLTEMFGAKNAKAILSVIKPYIDVQSTENPFGQITIGHIIALQKATNNFQKKALKNFIPKETLTFKSFEKKLKDAGVISRVAEQGKRNINLINLYNDTASRIISDNVRLSVLNSILEGRTEDTVNADVGLLRSVAEKREAYNKVLKKINGILLENRKRAGREAQKALGELGTARESLLTTAKEMFMLLGKNDKGGMMSEASADRLAKMLVGKDAFKTYSKMKESELKRNAAQLFADVTLPLRETEAWQNYTDLSGGKTLDTLFGALVDYSGATTTKQMLNGMKAMTHIIRDDIKANSKIISGIDMPVGARVMPLAKREGKAEEVIESRIDPKVKADTQDILSKSKHLFDDSGNEVNRIILLRRAQKLIGLYRENDGKVGESGKDIETFIVRAMDAILAKADKQRLLNTMAALGITAKVGVVAYKGGKKSTGNIEVTKGAESKNVYGPKSEFVKALNLKKAVRDYFIERQVEEVASRGESNLSVIRDGGVYLREGEVIDREQGPVGRNLIPEARQQQFYTEAEIDKANKELRRLQDMQNRGIELTSKRLAAKRAAKAMALQFGRQKAGMPPFTREELLLRTQEMPLNHNRMSAEERALAIEEGRLSEDIGVHGQMANRLGLGDNAKETAEKVVEVLTEELGADHPITRLALMMSDLPEGRLAKVFGDASLNAFGEHSVGTDIATVLLGRMVNGKPDYTGTAITVLHEQIHRTLASALETDKVFLREVQRIYAAAKKAGLIIEGTPESRSPQEFLSVALSDQRMVDGLSRLKYGSTLGTAWKSFVNSVKRLFGRMLGVDIPDLPNGRNAFDELVRKAWKHGWSVGDKTFNESLRKTLGQEKLVNMITLKGSLEEYAKEIKLSSKQMETLNRVIDSVRNNDGLGKLYDAIIWDGRDMRSSIRATIIEAVKKGLPIGEIAAMANRQADAIVRGTAYTMFGRKDSDAATMSMLLNDFAQKTGYDVPPEIETPEGLERLLNSQGIDARVSPAGLSDMGYALRGYGDKFRTAFERYLDNNSTLLILAKRVSPQLFNVASALHTEALNKTKEFTNKFGTEILRGATEFRKKYVKPLKYATQHGETERVPVKLREGTMRIDAQELLTAVIEIRQQDFLRQNQIRKGITDAELAEYKDVLDNTIFDSLGHDSKAIKLFEQRAEFLKQIPKDIIREAERIMEITSRIGDITKAEYDKMIADMERRGVDTSDVKKFNKIQFYIPRRRIGASPLGKPENFDRLGHDTMMGFVDMATQGLLKQRQGDFTIPVRISAAYDLLSSHIDNIGDFMQIHYNRFWKDVVLHKNGQAVLRQKYGQVKGEELIKAVARRASAMGGIFDTTPKGTRDSIGAMTGRNLSRTRLMSAFLYQQLSILNKKSRFGKYFKYGFGSNLDQTIIDRVYQASPSLNYRQDSWSAYEDPLTIHHGKGTGSRLLGATKVGDVLDTVVRKPMGWQDRKAIDRIIMMAYAETADNWNGPKSEAFWKKVADVAALETSIDQVATSRLDRTYNQISPNMSNRIFTYMFGAKQGIFNSYMRLLYDYNNAVTRIEKAQIGEKLATNFMYAGVLQALLLALIKKGRDSAIDRAVGLAADEDISEEDMDKKTDTVMERFEAFAKEIGESAFWNTATVVPYSQLATAIGMGVSDTVAWQGERQSRMTPPQMTFVEDMFNASRKWHTFGQRNLEYKQYLESGEEDFNTIARLEYRKDEAYTRAMERSAKVLFEAGIGLPDPLVRTTMATKRMNALKKEYEDKKRYGK